MRFASGNKFEGTYKDDAPGGRGTFTFPNGDECEGEWTAKYRLKGMGKGRSKGRFVKCYLEGKTIMFRN